MAAIRDSGIRIGVDPLGGSGVAYWEPVVERYGLNLSLISDVVDPTFSFMRRSPIFGPPRPSSKKRARRW